MTEKLTLNELREKREKIVTDQRALLDLAESEKRGMSADENTNYENMEAEYNNLDEQIVKMEADEAQAIADAVKFEQRKADAEKRLHTMKASAAGPIKPETGNMDTAPESGRDSEEHMRAFNSYLTHGLNAMPKEELRALQADSDLKGGFLVAPAKFMNDVIKDLDDLLFVRRFATVHSLTDAGSLTVPVLDPRLSDSDWTAELGTGDEDTTLAFKQRMLTPHPMAKRIKVSKTLVRLGSVSVDAIVRGEMAYKIALTEEKAFLTGDGVNKPLGVMTASNDGVSTNRDVSAGNTNNAIKGDGLINCLMSMEAQYRGNVRWLFHRDALKMIRKLKDGNGEYLWNSGIATHRPATILDKPYDESEHMPNTFSSGNYVGLLADWSRYWIVDMLGMTIEVLVELFALTNQIGYISRRETDAAPVHEKGFARVTLT